MKFRERIYRFMQGRYGAGGADAFTRFLSILTFVFILLSFFRVPFTYIIAIVLIAVALIVGGIWLYTKSKENNMDDEDDDF